MIIEPKRISKLPKDERGYPIPWFVHIKDGVPDFRVIGEGKMKDAIQFEKCWICGEKLGRNLAFVIGTMCAINRISSEPPAHLDCAQFSVKRCPFLSKPSMKRNEKGLEDIPEQRPGGIKRNPGVVLIWKTEKFWIVPVPNGALFRVGDPTGLEFWREGRIATRAEINESIESGLPILRGQAEKDGEEALKLLDRLHGEAIELINHWEKYEMPGLQAL